MTENKLKFFQVVISPEKNYATVKPSNYFLDGFDHNEITLLKAWLKEYIRCSSFSRDNIQILTNGSRLWLSLESSSKTFLTIQNS